LRSAQVALEIFSADGRNHLVVFSQSEREEVYRILSSKTSQFSQERAADAAMEGAKRLSFSWLADIANC
jgi:hypothetical protein